MTTPLDEGQNPDDLGDRPAVDLGDYPEFFAYGGARGAEPGPAKAQPGSYQGYEDYFRRPAESEPPVRSRAGGDEADGDEAEGAAGVVGAVGGSGVAGGDVAGASGPVHGVPAQDAFSRDVPSRDIPSRDAPPQDMPFRDDDADATRISRAVGHDGMPLVDVPPDLPAADDAPVRSRRGRAAEEPPVRSRGRQVPAPRGERDNAFKPADNAFGPVDHAAGLTGTPAGRPDGAFGPAAWDTSADGRAPYADPPYADPPYADPPAPPQPAPDYDYRNVAPAPEYDYRAPDISPAPAVADLFGADPFGTEPPRSRRASAPDPATPQPPVPDPALPDLRPAPLRQGTGRRRAKRSLASYLWPFRALTARPLTSTRIRSRSTAATVWRRLKSDRLALAGGVTIVVLILLAVFANVIDAVLGVDPTTLHPALTDPILGPHGSFGGMSADHLLGVDPSLGRDVLARLLSGARVSLLVAFASTLLAVGIGTTLGLVAGYLGGRTDAVISRLADLFLAFPLFLFALGLTGSLTDKAFGLSGNGLRIAVMIFVMGFFNWPYIARIVRAEVLSLREREFVDAARALGARRRWIIGRELMPNLLSPILVYATLLIPTNVIFEAGLSALGIGLNPPAASWGQMMLDASRTVYTDPAYLIVPGMAVFITVLAFNLFGDGLRDALDPTAQ